MSSFNHANSLLVNPPFGIATSTQRDSLTSLASANTLPGGYSAAGSAHSINTAATLPVGSPPHTDNYDTTPFDTHPRGSSATTLPAPFDSRPSSSSGLFGNPRPPRSSSLQGIHDSVAWAARETIPVAALPNPPAQPAADLKRDPFLVDLKESSSQPHEGTPLFPAPDAARLRGKAGSRVIADDAKLLMLPASCCMLIQTSVSAAVLWLSFDETGHRNGYEEGHLDPEDQHSGCQAAYFWLLLQAGLDLFLTLFTCMFLLSPLVSDPVGFHGCVATLRLCSLSAGFHILYLSGIKRDLCDQPLIIWSTIVIWLGIGVMAITFCYLFNLLLVGTSKQKRQLPFAPRLKNQDAASHIRSMQMHTPIHAQKDRDEQASRGGRGF